MVWLPDSEKKFEHRFIRFDIIHEHEKNRRIFVSPRDAPRLSHNMLHGWKDNSMLAKPLAVCTYLSSIVSESYDAEVNA